MNFLKNLIGGQIVKGYSISGEPITGLGHHKMWKLYKAKKDSTGGEVSVFVIEKKSLKPSNKDQIIKSAKKQVSTLAKIRHPGVLALIEPFTQDEHNISFVTERIEGNLSSIIRSKRFEEMVSSELELMLTLFPLLQTINFLHEIVKLCHLGLSFESIYVTAEGKWKVGGMNYSQVLTGEEYQPLEGNGEFWDYLHLAPEVVHEKKFNKFSDSYSLGVLFINFMVLLKKTPHNLMQPTESREMYSPNSKSYREYAQFPGILQSVAPQELIQLLSQLLIDQSTYRLPVSSLESSKWINDPIVLTVKYLQKISNYENKQQVEFLKGLAGVIDKFSGKVLHKRIIPNLTNLLKFNHLVASIVFILIDIMKKNMIAVEDWRKNVWPELKTITQGKQMTAQSLYLLISNMEVMEKFLPEESFMSSIIPLYLKCFDCPPKLKLLALRHVQRLTKKYDYQFTKTKIVPKLVVSMKDEKIQVRKDTLKALYGIVNRLDPHTIVNVVLVGLENCRKAGADPFINAITVQLYNKITLNMSAEVLANKIMPGLMPYLIDPSIQKEEFGLYKNALLNMMNKIEEERKKTWSQHNNSGVGKVEKFSEKDFVLEKIDTESGSASNINVSNEVRFEFLNDYKQVGSNSNVGGNAQQKPRSGQNITVTGANQSQPSGLSFNFEPVQPVNIARGQNQAIEITFTDSSFGSEFKSSFETGFNNQKQKVDVANYNKPQPEVKIESNTKVENTMQWDINSFGQTNSASNFGIGQNTNNDHTLPKTTKAPQYNSTQLDFGGFNQFQTHTQSKEIPFSPSTSPQTELNKPQIKGPQEVTGKKLVGPGQGGLKKPPKHNEFSLPTNNQTSSYEPLSFDSGFTTQPVNKPTPSTFNTNSFFNMGSSSTNTVIQPPPQGFGLQNKSDDPFAEVQSQYGVNNMNNFSFNQPASSGFSLNLNPPSTQSQSKDPFDDLL